MTMSYVEENAERTHVATNVRCTYSDYMWIASTLITCFRNRISPSIDRRGRLPRPCFPWTGRGFWKPEKKKHTGQVSSNTGQVSSNAGQRSTLVSFDHVTKIFASVGEKWSESRWKPYLVVIIKINIIIRVGFFIAPQVLRDLCASCIFGAFNVSTTDYCLCERA